MASFNPPDAGQLKLIEALAIGCHAVDRAGVEAGEFVLSLERAPSD